MNDGDTASNTGLSVGSLSDGTSLMKPNSEVTADKANEGSFLETNGDLRKKAGGWEAMRNMIRNFNIDSYNKKFPKGINWDVYASDSNYREMINYYYLEAKYNLNSAEIIKTGDGKITVKKDGKKIEMHEIPSSEAVFHNIHYNSDGTFYVTYDPDNKTGSTNRKFVNDDGYELVMTNDLKKIVTDPTVCGTYNYYTYGSLPGAAVDKTMHLVDINLWKNYGSGINDWTSKDQRLRANAIAEKLSNVLIVKDTSFQNWLKTNGIRKVTSNSYNEYLDYQAQLRVKNMKERGM